MSTQQEFLRDAAATLDLTQKELAVRMCAPWETFRKWLMPSESGSYREMPEIAWQLVLVFAADFLACSSVPCAST